MSSKKLVSELIYLLVIPLVCFGGIMFFRERFYSFVTAALAILTVAGYFLHFEKKHSDSTQLVIIAAMTALSVFGRIVFSFLPGFKPCTAIVIITALYMGRESGFMTGAMTALISNFYFGQGTWTPFQMLVWGLTGYFAGMLADKLIKSKPLLVTFGIISGAAFSLIMDLWSCLWADNAFVLSRYLALVGSSAFFTLIYAVSNVFFLLVLSKPFGRIFKRLDKKYGLKIRPTKLCPVGLLLSPRGVHCYVRRFFAHKKLWYYSCTYWHDSRRCRRHKKLSKARNGCEKYLLQNREPYTCKQR